MTAIVLPFLSGQSLLSHTYIPLRNAEGVQFVSNPWYFYPILLLFLLSLFLIRPLLEKVQTKHLFLDFVLHLTDARNEILPCSKTAI